MNFSQNCLIVIVAVPIVMYLFVLFETKGQRTYFKYLWRHKWFVFQECWRIATWEKWAMSLHLLWLGIIHDWRKYLPHGYIAYARNFYGEKCLPGGIEEKERKKAFMNAMRAHMKACKHHWSHWCFVGYKESYYIINDLETLDLPLANGMDDAQAFRYPLVSCDMPWIYVKEMIADWAGAGRAINGKIDPVGWYENMGGKMKFTEVTKHRIQTILEEHYE